MFFFLQILCAPSFIDQCSIGRFVLDVNGGLAKTKISCKAQPLGQYNNHTILYVIHFHSSSILFCRTQSSVGQRVYQLW